MSTNHHDGSSGDRLLDVREAAKLLGLKPSTLYQWAYERRVPTVKLFGRTLRFRLSDLEKLIATSVRAAVVGRAVSGPGVESLPR